MGSVKKVKIEWACMLLLIFGCGVFFWSKFPRVAMGITLDGSMYNGSVLDAGYREVGETAYLIILLEHCWGAFMKIAIGMLPVINGVLFSFVASGRVWVGNRSLIPLPLTYFLLGIATFHCYAINVELAIKVAYQLSQPKCIITGDAYLPYIFGIAVLVTIMYGCIMFSITLYSKIIDECKGEVKSKRAWYEFISIYSQREEAEVVIDRLQGRRGRNSQSYKSEYWYWEVLRLASVLLMIVPTFQMFKFVRATPFW